MEQKTKFFILLLIITISIFWIIEYPPLQDYPLYLERIFVLHNYNNPEFNFQKYYEINNIITSNIVNELVGLELIYFFPIGVVGKILITMTIIVFCFGLFKFFEIFHKNSLMPLMSVFFIYNVLFFYGFLNFIIGVGLFFFGLTELMKNQFKNRAELSLIILAIYLSHLFVFLMFALVLCVFLLEKKGRLFDLIVFMPSLILFSFYAIFGLSKDSSNLFNFVWNGTGEKLWLLGSQFMLFSNVSIFLTIILIAFLFYVFIIQIKNKAELNENQKIIAKLLLITMLMFFLLPRDTQNWGLVDLRPAIFIPIFFISLINTIKINKKVLTFFIFSIIVLSISLNFVLMNQTSETIKTIIEGRNMLEKNSTALFIFSECYYCITTTPTVHSDKYYTIYNGTIVPQRFIESKFLLINRKHTNEITVSSALIQSDFSIKKYGKLYDYIFLIGKNDKIEADIKKEFILRYQNEKIKMFKNINIISDLNENQKRNFE